MVESVPSFALIHNSIPISLSDQERLAPSVSVIRYGHSSQAIDGAVNATYRIVDTSDQGQLVAFDVMGHQWECMIPLLGTFQISNVLGALTAFLCSGGNLDRVIPALSNLKPLLGRMEHICSHNGGQIYVDYAHTPQGITLALQALRPCTKGKLGVIFGCGGDRDRSKRPLMGAAAAMYSDWIIVTDDNPRSEDPADIRQHILVGCPNAQSIAPRQEALRQAIACLQPGDCLLVAGKGHETTQIIGNHVLPHSDQECVRRYCQAMQ
jgi:UDP-N-acetylmuramoyl-L-alanyl-D-glutamate--2,6-diaminopimelate ligase